MSKMRDSSSARAHAVVLHGDLGGSADCRAVEPDVAAWRRVVAGVAE
jgi:hypothetical protein